MDNEEHSQMAISGITENKDKKILPESKPGYGLTNLLIYQSRELFSLPVQWLPHMIFPILTTDF